MFKIRITDQDNICITGAETSVVNSVGSYECKFSFDDSWKDLAIYACFKSNRVEKEIHILLTLDENNEATCTVPWEVLQAKGLLYVGACGLFETSVVKPTVWKQMCNIEEGVNPNGQLGQDPTPTVVEQLTALSTEAINKADQAIEEAGKAAEDIEALQGDVSDLTTVTQRHTVEIGELSDNKLDKSSVKNETGDSTTDTMSQKAITDAITKASPQVEMMPEVTSVPNGTVVQYVGADGNTYKKGHWYQSFIDTVQEQYTGWYDLGVTKVVVDTPLDFAKYEPNTENAGLYLPGIVMEYVGEDGQFNGTEVRKGYHYYFYYGNAQFDFAQVEPDVKTLPSLEGYVFIRKKEDYGHITDETNLPNYLKNTMFTYVGESTSSLTHGYHYYAVPNLASYQKDFNVVFETTYVWAQVEEYYPSYSTLPNYYPISPEGSQEEHFAIVRDRNTGKESRALWTGKYSSIGNNNWYLDKVEISSSSRMRELVGLVADMAGESDLPTPEGIGLDTVITYTGANDGYWRNGYHYKVEANNNNYTRLVQEETDYYGFEGLNINSVMDEAYAFKSPVTLMTPLNDVPCGIVGVSYSSVDWVQYGFLDDLVPIVSPQTQIVTVSGLPNIDLGVLYASLNNGVFGTPGTSRVTIFNLSDFSYYRILFTIDEFGQDEFTYVKVS